MTLLYPDMYSISAPSYVDSGVSVLQLVMWRRVVMSQLSGGGRGDIGSYNAEQYAALMTLLEEKPMKDGDEWLSTMMRRNKMLGT